MRFRNLGGTPALAPLELAKYAVTDVGTRLVSNQGEWLYATTPLQLVLP
ncbi:hypothetical protein LY474_20105 [Myxococcus stipitatus]|nr:hypothetical protein [Myxococcus stipitatus]MCE9670105.1 hypothetical protein [Myxococcus stipitatus]